MEYLMLYLGVSRITPKRIQTAVSEEKYALMQLYLLRAPYQLRKLLLEQLSYSHIKNIRFMKTLVNTVRKGFLEEAQLALNLLNSNLFHYPELKSQLAIATQEFEERKRRKENKQKINAECTSKTLDSLVYDRSKMKALNHLKTQLKKGIRLH